MMLDGTEWVVRAGRRATADVEAEEAKSRPKSKKKKTNSGTHPAESHGPQGPFPGGAPFAGQPAGEDS